MLTPIQDRVSHLDHPQKQHIGNAGEVTPHVLGLSAKVLGQTDTQMPLLSANFHDDASLTWSVLIV